MFEPEPINCDDVILSDEIKELAELLAKNTHQVWAKGRIEEGWVYGVERNDEKKTNPLPCSL